MYGLSVASLASQSIPVATFPLFGPRSENYDRFGMLAYQIGPTMAVTSIAIGLLSPETRPYFPIRLVILCFILGGSVIAFYRILAVTRGRERALALALETAERDAQTSRALLAAERNYAEARDVARLRSEQLAAASHDIKQPLMSLRTTMDAVTREQPPEVRTQLRDAFDYLEQLAGSYMDEVRPTASDDVPEPQRVETVPVTLFTETLDRMFRAEAEAKGLTFEVHGTTGSVEVQPLIMMRILGNLLSNAIKHTATGSVALTAQKVADRTILTIANSGTPLNERQVATLFEPYRKGDSSAGDGLGLAIVRHLSGIAGLTLRFDSDPASPRPKHFSLTLPS